MDKVFKFFKLKENDTTVMREVIAGATTFAAIAYIIFLNPNILAETLEENPLAANYKNGIFIATCLSGFICTALSALLARIPITLAPGMGINTFFTYTVVLGMGYTYEQALSAIFLSGMLFTVINLFGLREAITEAVPASIKSAIGSGIFLLLVFKGLRSAGISSDGAFINFSKEIIPAAVGFIVICVLYKFKIKGSLLIGVLSAALIGIPLSLTSFKNIELISIPPFGDFIEYTLFRMDFSGFILKGFDSLILIITFLFINIFDVTGIFAGLSKKIGEPKNNAFLSASIASSLGACLGTSTVTPCVESGSGIAEGGRTGISSLVTSLLFLLALIFAPLIGIIPMAAVAPALIFTGIVSIKNFKEFGDNASDDLTETVPALLTVIITAVGGITAGIAFGMVSHTLLKLLTGKSKELNILSVLISVQFIILFVLTQVKS